MVQWRGIKRGAGIHRRWSQSLCLLSLGALLMAGCSKSAQPGAEVKVEEKHDPATITVGVIATGYLSEDEFNKFLVEPVKKKYPWITVQRVIYTTKNMNEFVVGGNVPDIIITNNVNGMPNLASLDLLDSMDALIKKHALDLTKIEDGAVDAVKMASQRQDIVALPYTRNFAALYYNKDIFDKFAVPYPKDGMTWEQATELAKQVTRMVDGVQYRGLEPNVSERLGAQLSLTLVDRQTNRTVVNTDPWKKVFTQMASIYGIPGNGTITVKAKGDDLFAKNRTLAMLAEGNILGTHLNDKADFNWDLASIPVWPEAPTAGTSADEHLMVLAKTSKQKDDAFRVISTVLSEEVQTDMSKNGRTSILKDPAIQKVYGENLPFLKGKNIQAIFKTQLAKPYEATMHDPLVMSGLATELSNVVTKGKDINSALRDAEEAINKKIQEALVK
ncbi:extracellular solute-binding protein [Paenibacillus sp. UNC451MF]|uniref:extracellular solute-binding protein n=1 Tax=Paenibacillus sp. UNC451MF TaxID=1449063 RepID=UPI00048DF85D|nr:extracellular solute-binding protein [Paenibacillus sp. UNC451MF]